jgi:hypothetical protein
MFKNYLFSCVLITCLSLVGCGGGTPDTTKKAESSQEEPKESETVEVEKEPEVKLEFNEEKAKQVLTGYFTKFSERNFAALQDYYTPEVKQFITLRNIKAADVSKNAKNFFRGKTNVYYTPDFSRIDNEIKDERFVINLPLEMVWSENTTNTDYEEGQNYKSRSASVILELTMTPNYKIESYREKTIIRPKYELLEDLTAINASDETVQITLKKGAIVTDNYEKRFGNMEGSQIKVLYNGKSYWIPEYKEGFGRGGVRLIERVE